MIPASEALEKLRDGNRRFRSGHTEQTVDHEHLQSLVAGQAPHTAILACSDSRAAPEWVFDQGLGDLFVVRVAGNVAGHTEVASIEFAAEALGARLVVVMGHSNCGAVQACMNARHTPPPFNLRHITNHITPAIAQSGSMVQAVRANVEHAVKVLRESKVLSKLSGKEGLLVTGALYSLESGEVSFYDG